MDKKDEVFLKELGVTPAGQKSQYSDLSTSELSAEEKRLDLELKHLELAEKTE